jgi:class 3 adenylate cyclase/pimeloyl-ACP methyl ester carboxylesterase
MSSLGKRRESTRMDTKIQFAKRKDGVRIGYSIFGTGVPFIYPAPWVSNIAFLLENQMARAFWERVARYFTVVFYDKHGCGHSDRNRTEFTLESELFDLEAVVGHIGLEEFILFGTSMAGPASIAYTVRHKEKVKHLVLYGTYANGRIVTKDEVKLGLISLIRGAWGVGSKILIDIFIPGASMDVAQQYAVFQRESCTSEMAARLLELVYNLDVTGLLPSIQTRTLVLHREGDKAIPIHLGRELAMEIPNALFKVLQGDIHLPWLGESDKIIEEICAFVGVKESKTSDAPLFETSPESRRVEDRSDFSAEVSEIVEQATIVFSDIVSSTELVTRIGDAAARDIFLRHDKIVRDQITKHRGRELQNLGDGFMLSFESPSAAIRCACDMQKELSKNVPSIKIRIGINTGEVVRREGRQPFGQAVVVASRLANKAKAEQILVLDVTKHLVAGSGFSFVERGRAKLKGIGESFKLYEVVWQITSSS